MRTLTVAVLASLVGVPLMAQEIGVFGVHANARHDRNALSGAGVTLGTSFRLGSIFAERLAISRSKMGAGLRLSASSLRGNDQAPIVCFDGGLVGPCSSNVEHTRLQTYEGTLLLLPHMSSSTRLEIGTGLAKYIYRGDVRADSWGFIGSAALSRRLVSRAPVWLTVGAESRGSYSSPLTTDETAISPPKYSFRAGLSYRLQAR